MQKECDYYNREYIPKMNRIGIVTSLLGILGMLLPAIVLWIVYGLYPIPSKLISAVLTGTSSFGILWFVEPISYYTILGTTGTYMSFLSGNCSNLRVPCSGMAQLTAGVKPGTPQGDIISTIGIAISVVVNISILTIGAFLGSILISVFPKSIQCALDYLLPALFGVLLVQFGVREMKQTLLILIVALCIYSFSGKSQLLYKFTSYFGLLFCIILSVLLSIVVRRHKE